MNQITVCYRKFSNGDVIAIFPGIAVDAIPQVCQSYMHVGQHSGASIDLLHDLDRALYEELLPLHMELIDIYNDADNALALRDLPLATDHAQRYAQVMLWQAEERGDGRD